MQRIRELALQSANDTNTSLDRTALQEEVSQLIAEIANIADITNFNGKKLLDGSFTNAVFQTGANLGDTISVSVAELSTDTLGTGQANGVSSRDTTTALIEGTTGGEMIAGDIVINGVAIAAAVGTDDNKSLIEGEASSIAKAAAINKSSAQTGVTATVDKNVVEGSSTADATTLSSGISVAINGVDILLDKSSTMTVIQNLTTIAAAINEKTGATGVTAVFSGDSNLGITLEAADGRNIVIGSSSATATFGIATAGNSEDTERAVYVGTYTLVSDDGSDIVVTTDTGNIDNAGFEAGTFSGVTAGAVSDAGTIANVALATGDLIINGVAVGAGLTTDDTASSVGNANSAIAKAAAINKVSDQSGVTATANANRVYGGDITQATTTDTITLNGVSIILTVTTIDSVAVKQASIISAINLKSGASGVRAEALDADSITLVADDGRNINLVDGTALLVIADTLFVSSVVLSAGGQFTLTSNTNNISNSGFRLGTFGGGSQGSFLKDVDISTVAGANSALIAVDNALQTVSSRAAELGAVQNRFTNTIANLEVGSENLSAANSRIKDADFAAETAALSRTQVLQQAGISILAQANARPQQVLSLLQ